MTVRPDSPHRMSYKGRQFLFCSAGCKARFEADPEHYLGTAPSLEKMAGPAPARAEASPAAGGRIEYTCPMHPQIVTDRPGSCPICGMALEPRTITAEEIENPELQDMKRRFWASVALTAPIMLGAVLDL